MELLYPERRTTSPEELAEQLRAADLAPEARPYLGLNMVSALDGKATLEWRTQGLSSEFDRKLFHALRAQVDAVMVGAGTARAERYGRIAKASEVRERRREQGRDPDPVAVIVSGRLDLPADLPLLQEPDQKVVIVTSSDATLEGLRCEVAYIRGGEDLPRVMAELQSEHGIRSVLCEGGPTLNSYLFAAGVVDELFLSLSPQVVGGASALTIVAGKELVDPPGLDLVSLAEGDSELFTRWRLRR